MPQRLPAAAIGSLVPRAPRKRNGISPLRRCRPLLSELEPPLLDALRLRVAHTAPISRFESTQCRARPARHVGAAQATLGVLISQTQASLTVMRDQHVRPELERCAIRAHCMRCEGLRQDR